MKALHSGRLGLLAVLVLAGSALLKAADQPAKVEPPTPNNAQEALAKAYSPTQAADFLDRVALSWTQQRQCGACHTNYAYLIGRPALKTGPSPAHEAVRAFFEKRVTNWDSTEKGAKPRWDAEVVATATALAINDAHTTAKLHPVTRKALDRMWTVQQKDGGFSWLKCNWPPYEHDDFCGALFAVVAVAQAPDNYAQTDTAKAGLERLRNYFKANPTPDLHHKAWLLWASLKLDGLMSKEERQATVKELRELQNADGGWSLASLGKYERRDKSPNDPKISDGFGTGFVLYILRQADVPANDPQIQRGVAWLKSNQRESGRWFTRSVSNDKAHYITNAGSAWAVLALAACEK